MGKKSNKISTRWVLEIRGDFRIFLDETGFPDPQRMGERGPNFNYPEWVIVFIAILSVRLKIKTYVQVHKMAVKYRDVTARGLELTPISERQLRKPLKKSVISLENQKRSFFSSFLSLSKDEIISADEMMNKTKGAVWHKKHKDKDFIPIGLQGIDQQATWCKSVHSVFGVV